jgi:membrane-associated protease RseP (regulator of RpoE activity)
MDVVGWSASVRQHLGTNGFSKGSGCWVLCDDTSLKGIKPHEVGPTFSIMTFAGASLMRAFFLIFVAISAASMIHVLFMAMIGWILGARVQIVSLFFGPKLLSAKIMGVDFRISLWPLGGYVKFYEDKAESSTSSNRSFQDLHPLKRILIAASGPLGLLLCAANLIGLSHVSSSFVNGFAQFFTGAVMPLSQGQFLLRRLSQIATGGSVQLLLALMAVKLAAFNLLPFPTLNGGYILLEMVRALVKIPEKISERLSILGFLMTAAIMCGWLIATIYYSTH